MTWSANTLEVGYARKMVGFDLRLSHALYPESGEAAPCLGSWHERKARRLSLDVRVWPSVLSETEKSKGTNALDLVDSTILLAELKQGRSEECVVVGFDLPQSLLCSLPRPLGIQESPLSIVESFTFCGYDVAGWDGQYSGFYSFDWDIGEMTAFLAKNEITLNAYGLVDDQAAAIRAAIAFDAPCRGHDPFVPYGVWIKKSNGDDFQLSGGPR